MKSSNVISFLHYILGMIFNLVFMGLVVYAVYAFTILGFNRGALLAQEMTEVGEDYTYEFVLEEDTPATEVARRLEERGIINNRHLFNLEIFLMGRVRTYSAGTFILNSSMSNTEVHQTMRGVGAGQAPHEDITTLEGWTIADMATYFEYREFFAAEEFLYVAHSVEEWVSTFSFLMDVPDRPNGLEGYLFPDTYQIPINPSPGDIISRMLRQFDQVFTIELRDQAYEMGLTIDEVVIMASIIEREAQLAHERPMVSGVIHNRLAIDMNLEMCSTVAYVLDVPRDRLLLADLLIDSPYNTYQNPGFPIGPIANPGTAAIRAALNPANHNYLFFVLYDMDTREHFFSRTYEEHNAAIARAEARGVR